MHRHGVCVSGGIELRVAPHRSRISPRLSPPAPHHALPGLHLNASLLCQPVGLRNLSVLKRKTRGTLCGLTKLVSPVAPLHATDSRTGCQDACLLKSCLHFFGSGLAVDLQHKKVVIRFPRM